MLAESTGQTRSDLRNNHSLGRNEQGTSVFTVNMSRCKVQKTQRIGIGSKNKKKRKEKESIGDFLYYNYYQRGKYFPEGSENVS